MKIYAYILIVLSGVLTAQCSKVTLDEICGYPSAPGGGNGEGEGNGDYTSYWYYSYEAAQLIDAETLGMETAEDFTPYTVAHLGDTLFIANIGKAGSSLLLFSIKKGERLGTLQSWQHDGGEKSFGSQIEAIVPSGNRLYVAERQSRIHVFRLPELSYLTCIGNGQWSGPVFQAQAMTVKDELIFARGQERNGQHLQRGGCHPGKLPEGEPLPPGIRQRQSGQQRLCQPFHAARCGRASAAHGL